MFGQETRALINSMFIACSQITIVILGWMEEFKKQIAHKSPDRLLFKENPPPTPQI